MVLPFHPRRFDLLPRDLHLNRLESAGRLRGYVTAFHLSAAKRVNELATALPVRHFASQKRRAGIAGCGHLAAHLHHRSVRARQFLFFIPNTDEEVAGGRGGEGRSALIRNCAASAMSAQAFRAVGVQANINIWSACLRELQPTRYPLTPMLTNCVRTLRLDRVRGGGESAKIQQKRAALQK